MPRAPSLAALPLLAALAAAVPGCQGDSLGRARPPVSCTPDCFDRDCGEDGCGGTCGTCGGDRSCEALSGRCVGGDEGLVQGTLLFEHRPGLLRATGVRLDAPELLPGTGMMAVVAGPDGTVLGAREVRSAEGDFAVPVSRPLRGDETLLLSAFWAPRDEVLLAVLQPPYEDFNRDVPLPVWSWSRSVPADGRLGDVVVRESQGSGALFLHLINARAQAAVLDAVFEGEPGGLVRLGLLWAPGLMWSCGACYADFLGPRMEAGPQLMQTIFIGDEPDGSGPWSWPVLLHEFGHYVASNYSRDSSPGGPHYIGQTLAPAFAWSEGWASFFGAMTATRWYGEPRPVYWDIQGGSSFWIDFDGAVRSDGSEVGRPLPKAGQNQDLDENYVTAVLWALWEGRDGIEPDGEGLATGEILRAVSSLRFLGYDRAGIGSDLVDFLDSAACLFPERASVLRDRVVLDLGFPWDGDPLCPSSMGRRGTPEAGGALRARASLAGLPLPRRWDRVPEALPGGLSPVPRRLLAPVRLGPVTVGSAVPLD